MLGPSPLVTRGQASFFHLFVRLMAEPGTCEGASSRNAEEGAVGPRNNSRRDEVLARGVALAIGCEIERPSNDLFDDTAVEVDARTELGVSAGHGCGMKEWTQSRAA